ncbi:MAG: peptidylprolyl isomerase, partial [bacterium]
SDDNVVAEIGDYTLTAQEVNRRLEAAFRNQMIPREMAAVYVPQLIDSLITNYAVVQKAQQLGMRVSEQDLANAIRLVLPQLFAGGEFAGKQAYETVLAQQNTTIPEFEANLRNQILMSRLQNLVAEGVVVSPAEIEREYRRRNEKVKLEYVALSLDKVRASVTVTPDEVRSHFEANKAQYTIPEKRTLEVIIADQAKIAERINLTDEALRRAYQENQDQFRVPDRVLARHILLTTTGKPADEIPAIQARAEDILKQLKAGADFGKLASQYSQDPGSASQGGDLGWIVKGQTVQAFENTAFSLNPGELSNVVKTEYGFHIIQVLNKEQAHMKSFEEVKGQLATELKTQQAVETVQRLADQARDELARTPRQSAEIAAKLGLQQIRLDKVGPTAPFELFGLSPEIWEAAAVVNAGGVTPVVQVGPEKLAVAAVTEVVPSRPAELAEVEDQIRKQLSDQKAAALLDERAKQAFEQARSAGDLKSVAQSMGLEIKTTQEFTRMGAADGIGSASLLAEAFERPTGTVFGPVAVQDQRFIIKIAGKTPADMSQLESQREMIRSVVKNDRAQERIQLFQEAVRDAFIKSGDIKIHKEVVDRITGSYRG